MSQTSAGNGYASTTVAAQPKGYNVLFPGAWRHHDQDSGRGHRPVSGREEDCASGLDPRVHDQLLEQNTFRTARTKLAQLSCNYRDESAPSPSHMHVCMYMRTSESFHGAETVVSTVGFQRCTYGPHSNRRRSRTAVTALQYEASPRPRLGPSGRRSVQDNEGVQIVCMHDAWRG